MIKTYLIAQYQQVLQSLDEIRQSPINEHTNFFIGAVDYFEPVIGSTLLELEHEVDENAEVAITEGYLISYTRLMLGLGELRAQINIAERNPGLFLADLEARNNGGLH